MAAILTSETIIDFSRIDRIASWATDQGLAMRGHVLVWHRSIPTWLLDGYLNGTYLNSDVARMVEWYIQQVMTHFSTHYPGLIIAWDAVNEAIGPNDPTVASSYGLRQPGYDYLNLGQDFWRLSLGDDYVGQVFQWAHAADPTAKLMYNDYHNEYLNLKGSAIRTLVDNLISQNVPIHGIGLQCHFAVNYLDMSFPGIEFSMQSIANTVKSWCETGLDVQITELDIGIQAGQESRQAQFYADLIGATIIQNGVSAFTTWGFSDLVSWRSDESALYFDTALQPKPAYYTMLQALQRW
jgi:endo-1,4-beta-xylanase